MSEQTWGKCRKKPIEVEFREPYPEQTVLNREDAPLFLDGKQIFGEYVHTREGRLLAMCGYDYVIKGVEGELYPIGKEIFAKTYDVTKPILSQEKSNEVKTQ